jgi:peptidyl-Lys metalloendopeptidase
MVALIASLCCACADLPERADGKARGSDLELRLTELQPGSGHIEYTLTNHSASPVRVLRWQTALHEHSDQLFRVYRDGSEVTYLGPFIHRPQPQRSHYLELAPGQSLTANVDLTARYDMGELGSYEVRTVPFAREFVLEQGSVTVPGTVSLAIEVDAERHVEDPAEIGVKSEALAFSECDEMESFVLELAQAFALAYATEGADHYATYGHDARGELWFGIQGPLYRAGIRNTLNGIRARLEANNLTYHCSETFGIGCADALAITYPWLPNFIQICDLFFADDLVGAYSMAATIVHEVAHLQWMQDVMFNGDYTRTVQQVLALAASYPGQAAVNAENYAMYTVNPPPETP